MRIICFALLVIMAFGADANAHRVGKRCLPEAKYGRERTEFTARCRAEVRSPHVVNANRDLILPSQNGPHCLRGMANTFLAASPFLVPLFDVVQDTKHCSVD